MASPSPSEHPAGAQGQDPVTIAKSNKRQLATWIASAWLLFIAAFVLSWLAISGDGLASVVITLPSRIAFGFAHVFGASLILFLGFLFVGATRWHLETQDAGDNPALRGDAGEGDIHNRVAARILGNSAEQFIMFAAALLAASCVASVQGLRLITAATVLWLMGRFFFWGGYWYTAVKGLPTYPRALGLGMGLLCTWMLAAMAVLGICRHYPDFGALTATVDGPAAVAAGQWVLASAGATGSNLLPVALVSFVVLLMPVLAFFPRFAPPVIPIALISVGGWLWALASGTVALRFG